MTSPPTKRSQSPPNGTSNGNGNGNGNLVQRAAPRPPPRSNFDLEPNPFEHSFSSTSVSHGHGQASNTETPKHESNSNEHTRTRSGSGSNTSNNTKGMTNVANAKEENDESKPMLPPLAAIESPAGHGFGPWGLGNSLRSGPLSPAMLAGPTTQQTPSLGLGAFDSSFVRTGLTPDVSRTGLTPLIGGPGGFPPPSPNTAALFALVSGTGATAPLGSNVPITPGTFNAITGALNQSLNAIHQPTSMSLEQPQSTVDHQQQHQQQQNNNGTYQNSDAFSTHDSASLSNAASALYLLSQQQIQRHQNQAQNAAAAAAALAQGQGQVNPSAVSGPPQQTLPDSPTTTVAPTRRATKRKTMEAPVPVPRGKKARSASASGGVPAGGVSTRGANRRKNKMEDEMDEEDDDEDDEDDDMYMDGTMAPPSQANIGRTSGGSGRSKKPETEEEKRRNFLERNRQAALKCRQRKKAWLTALQAKVEFLTSENERLSNALVTSREEVVRLSQAVVAQGGAPSALLNLEPSPPNGSTIINNVNAGNESTASPVDHGRRNSGSSTTTAGQSSIQNAQQPLHVNVPLPTMSSGLNHGMAAHHGHSHSMGHNGVPNVGAIGHSRSHSHGHGHAGVPAQNGVTVGGRGYGY